MITKTDNDTSSLEQFTSNPASEVPPPPESGVFLRERKEAKAAPEEKEHKLASRAGCHVLYAPYRMAGYFAAAGYDPALIPETGRLKILDVAMCHEKGIFDVEVIAAATKLSKRQVRIAIEALRKAARPGTVTG